MKRMLLLVLFSLCVPAILCAQEVLFEDEFEGDLSVWEINAFGQIVTDPLDSTNHALSFSHTNVAGDLFSPVIALDININYVFTFKYLGNADGDETGGYLWLGNSADNSDVIVWSTQPVGVDGSENELIDDGQWHTYELEFNLSDAFDQPCEAIQIVIEDWSGAASGTPPPNIAGDALFDDIQIYELGDVSNRVQWTVGSGGNDHWYELVYVENSITWEDAKSQAESMGGYLATITSVEENNWVFQSMVIDFEVFSGVLIGGFHNQDSQDYSEPAGGWEWVTGEPWDYEAWRSGEPNDGGDRGKYLEYAVGPSQIIGWNDTGDGPIDPSYYFVVEIGQVDLVPVEGTSWGSLKSIWR